MSLVFREDYTLGKCDLKDVHAESPRYGLPFARWQAFHIDRHSADLCEGCRQIWATSWTDNGGTVQTIKRNNMIFGKGNR